MATDALIGTYLGKYKLEELIGRGGMAEVYRATQINLQRDVAIKVMHRFLSDDSDFLSRFEREARVMAKIRHPNIVHVHDYEVEDNYYYIVMDYLSGGTLKNQLDRLVVEGGVIDLKRAARVTLEIGEALAYAHQAGMVHRDIKPANIMFDDKGVAILTDFGIARMVGGSSHTTTGSMIGTPAYMSPEQGLGESGDERSDIYSLGVLAFHLFTGRLPFEGDTPLSVVLKHVNELPPKPSSINPDIPQALEQIVLKAMDKNPDNRWESVTEMKNEIRSVIRSENLGNEDDFLFEDSSAEHHTPAPSLTIPNSEHDSLASRMSRKPVPNSFVEQSNTIYSDKAVDPSLMAQPHANQPSAFEQKAEIQSPPAELDSLNLLPNLPAPEIPSQPTQQQAPTRAPAYAPTLPPVDSNEGFDLLPNTPDPETQDDLYESLGAEIHNKEMDEAFSGEMSEFIKDFEKSAEESAKLKPEINPLRKKEIRQKQQKFVGRVVRGVLVAFFVIAGIIFGILFVTRINPSFSIQNIIDEQLNNPDINEIDLSQITADISIATSGLTRGTIGEQGIVLVISNQTSVPPNWVGELQLNVGEDEWEAISGRSYLFDSNNEIAIEAPGSLSSDGVYRWVIKSGENSLGTLGTSAPFLIPASGEILDVEVDVR
ncbi:MAG: serine/threonine-protein kinase [Chloroflexota bacterium]